MFKPDPLWLNGEVGVERYPGQLAFGNSGFYNTWGWGDVDELGYNTIYVCIQNWKSFLSPTQKGEGFIEMIPMTTFNKTDVSFNALNSLESTIATPAVRAAMWGSDNPVVSSVLNADGSRMLSWPAPADTLSRTYTVWFTTRLTSPWQLLAEVKNFTEYVDDQHNDEPVIFYRVTVQ